MPVLVAGLLLFLGVHTLPMAPATRLRLHGAWGEQRYKLAYTVVSLIGLALIVVGWRSAGPGPQLFAPFRLAIAAAPYVMTLVFILLASSHSPSHIRATVKHPML